MTDTKLLESLIQDKGITKTFIAKQLGITKQGLWLKIENKSQFKPSEIKELCKILGITSLKQKERIFFAEFVDK